MTLKLKGSSDGSVSLQAPADTVPTGTDKTLILPTGIGTAGQYLKNSATPGTLEFGTLPVDGITWETTQSVVGLTSFTWTGIPSTTKELWMVFSNVSAGNADNTTEAAWLRFGNGSIDSSTSYAYNVQNDGNSVRNSADSKLRLNMNGWQSNALSWSGIFHMVKLDTHWVGSWQLGDTADAFDVVSNGTVRYTGNTTIDRVQLLMSSTNAWDNGKVMIGYE